MLIALNAFFQLFRALCRREQIIEDWGHTKVVLSSANSFSYEKRKIMFKTYCDTMMGPQKLKTPANGKWDCSTTLKFQSFHVVRFCRDFLLFWRQ